MSKAQFLTDMDSLPQIGESFGIGKPYISDGYALLEVIEVNSTSAECKVIDVMYPGEMLGNVVTVPTHIVRNSLG